MPTAWHVLPRVLRYIGVSESDTFIDFGCGKGRVVHQAARYPFRRVIGIEVVPELAEIAREAIATGKHRYKCQDVQIVVADATEYEIPDDLTVAYFFRPFRRRALVHRPASDSRVDRSQPSTRLAGLCLADELAFDRPRH